MVTKATLNDRASGVQRGDEPNLPWRWVAQPEKGAGPGPNVRQPPPGGAATLMDATLDAGTVLRDVAAAAAEAATRALTVAALLDEALAALTAEGMTAAPPPPAAAWQGGTLSPREREVLELVAAGHSNKAIARALFVSPNTVKTHVASLLNKLQADSRVQLAAIATQQRLHAHAAIGAR